MIDKELEDFMKEYRETTWKKFEEEFVKTQPMPKSAGKILTDAFKESANNE